LGLFTSLSHPWGGAPTYVLPEYVVGIRPVQPGYKVFTVVPAYEGFDLSYAQASVKTKYGTLSIKWELSNDHILTVMINAPAGTSGTIQLPGGKVMARSNVNGNISDAETTTVVDVQSGKTNAFFKV